MANIPKAEEEPTTEVVGNETPTPDEPRELYLGAPSAFSQDCRLLHADSGSGIPGCRASVQCGNCGQAFTADLLSDAVKICPQCGDRYTHLLVLCAEDDSDTALYVIGHIFRENDAYPNPEDDDESGDDEGEENDAEGIPEADE